ncbi:MAG: hypothetical protein A2X56_09540 [Nitrospirae bacterium GWC2_57_13]|nr:MAG: hypothetical protein A2X56_09540 [Nitrospirae bacterium GWC2_57_13]OGW43538.1 MAG: hypothetical protein A2X57_11315 [Nitrospirae bacterium GWD2_57_8]HAR46663.1 ATP-dependent Clp protease adaptor ClpS [Nitrospiraceae bacterium]
MPNIPSTKTAAAISQKRELIPRFRVLLHNDDVNTPEHVVKALMHVFKFTVQECERIMMEAHNQGVALCTIEPLEQAEHHRDQLHAFSLTATIEPE